MLFAIERLRFSVEQRPTGRRFRRRDAFLCHGAR